MYHREIKINYNPNKVRVLRLKEFKEHRSSKEYQKMRKSVGVFRSQDLFERENDHTVDLKLLMNEIIE